MLEYIIVCSVIYVILAVVGVIMIVREAKKVNDKEDMILIIISFLVPIIGLIIYAINVGKDKHIVDCVLKGLKMVLKLIITEVIISIVIISIGVLNISIPSITKKEYITIPDVSGYSVEKAIIDLENAGFKVNAETIKINDDAIPKGDVVKTSPQAGSKRENGTTITIYISTGE